MNSPLSYIDPNNVNSVSVMAGITPVSMGGDSIGGTIQADSATPEFAKLGECPLLRGQAGTYYRSNGNAFGLNLSTMAANEYFSLRYSGSLAKAGEILVRQDTSSEEAQLRAAEAAATLAKLNMDRFGKLLSERTIAQSQFDNAEATLKQAAAQADTIRASIAKKTIRAPFTGRLGIRLVNLGQVINEGQPIVSLQALDPIFVDFSLPQQQLSLVQPGQTARLTSDALPGEVVEGKITAINPQVDAATRNIRVQATVANPRELLRPGMFVNVSVVLPVRQPVLAIPATAVLYAPYSDSVFVVEEKVSEKSGQPAKVVRQQFAQLGEKRGDFVAVVSGLKAGDIVVSTGVFKLRNGQDVVVDNTLAPEFKLDPKPPEI